MSLDLTVPPMLAHTPLESPRTSTAHDGPVYTVAPRDLTFLLAECRRCLWRKVKLGKPRPRTPFPSIFQKFDRLQRGMFDGASTSAIDPSLGAGLLSCADARVVSKPISVPGAESRIRFRGAIDCVIKFESGEVGIIDFKTTSPHDDHVSLYTLQLHSYAHSFENPAVGPAASVAALGLLCFDPSGMVPLDEGRYAYVVDQTWIPIARDDGAFMAIVGLVCGMLDSDTAPQPGPRCGLCSREVDGA